MTHPLKKVVLNKRLIIMISVSEVTKNFDEVHALKEVNLDIATGEFVTIVGPSGCGKSTLLRIIAGSVSYTHLTLPTICSV